MGADELNCQNFEEETLALKRFLDLISIELKDQL